MLIVLAYAEPPTAVAPAPPQPTSGPLRYYPEVAWRNGVEGSAIIHCKVTPEKKAKLTDCTVLTEEPVGAGFGEAAIRMSALFVMHPATRNGEPVESEINVPIKFQLPKR